MKILLAIPSILISLSAGAQEESWDAYIADYDGKPGSTLVNMSLKEIAPKQDLHFVLVTGVTYKNCSADGLPVKGEFENLYAISEAIEKLLHSHTKNILVGTFTHNCQRLDYYYVKDTTGIRQAMENTYKNRFAGYLPYINIKEDKEWSYYLKFLYPSQVMQEFMSNQKVVIALSEAGDKNDIARLVDHWAYFKKIEDRNCFRKSIESLGFKAEAEETLTQFEYKYKLRFSRMDKVDMNTITTITGKLNSVAASCNGDYDGWESPVVKE